MTKKYHVLSIAFLAAALMLNAACGGGGGEETSGPAPEGGETTPTTTAGETYKPTGDEGTITGKVNFTGEAPKMPKLSMDSDPACASKHTSPVMAEQVVVNSDNTLKNVIVFVKSGLGDKKFDLPAPAELDQDGCLYIPHVLGLMANQQVRILTKDNTTHNIHPTPRVNREWNESQPPGSDPLVKTFTRPEELFPVKCNQHPWMTAYIAILDHPFFAVTGADGSYTISGLPPGEYEVVAHQEKYGESQPMKVTVAAKGSATADFTFNADQAYRPGTLKLMPAIELGGH